MAAHGPDPSPSFRFRVKIDGIDVARFTECSGIEFEQETFDYKEGGLNSYVHRLPGRFKFNNINLKKGIATDGRALRAWVADVVKHADSGRILTRKITITLFDVDGHTEQCTWNFVDAYPVKWSASALTAEQSAIAIETFTFAHQGMNLTQAVGWL